MGMQCHFNIKDLPGFESNPSIEYDMELELYTYHHNGYAYDCDIKGNAYFDIGQMSERALEKLRYLIQNRVCFNCS